MSIRTEDPTALESVTVRLRPQDRAALRSEALRRATAGVTHRLDVSALVREAIEFWGQAKSQREPRARAS